jgi:hypothetical protein
MFDPTHSWNNGNFFDVVDAGGAVIAAFTFDPYSSGGFAGAATPGEVDNYYRCRRLVIPWSGGHLKLHFSDLYYLDNLDGPTNPTYAVKKFVPKFALDLAHTSFVWSGSIGRFLSGTVAIQNLTAWDLYLHAQITGTNGILGDHNLFPPYPGTWPHYQTLFFSVLLQVSPDAKPDATLTIHFTDYLDGVDIIADLVQSLEAVLVTKPLSVTSSPPDMVQYVQIQNKGIGPTWNLTVTATAVSGGIFVDGTGADVATLNFTIGALNPGAIDFSTMRLVFHSTDPTGHGPFTYQLTFDDGTASHPPAEYTLNL